APGIWTLIVDFAEPVVGNEVSQPYTGNIRFNQARASATGLPNSASTKLTAGHPVSVTVKIINRGAAAADFFVDPRLNTSAVVTLAPLNPPETGLSLPLVGVPPLYLVPAQTSSVSVTASASLPIMFDYNAATGSPDLASSASGAGPLCSATPSSSYTAAGG